MTENRPILKIVADNSTKDTDNAIRKSDVQIPPQAGYITNPMYEKLVKFKLEQQRKRFTVEDLLKW